MKNSVIPIRKVMNAVVLAAIIILSLSLLGLVVTQVKDLITGYERIENEHVLNPLLDLNLVISADAIGNQPDAVHQAAFKSSVIYRISMTIYMILVLIILFQLRKIIKSLSAKKFFLLENLKIVRNIAGVMFAGVAVYFILYQISSIILPLDIMEQNIVLIPMSESIWKNLSNSVDFNDLFIAFLLYILSVTLREGVKLQEQTDLMV